MTQQIEKHPSLAELLKRLFGRILKKGRQPGVFPGSASYWEQRYASGANSGVGSYSKFADFKAETINSFVAARRVTSVIELGCGDGNQLTLAAYPEYLGLDVSDTVVSRCREKFAADATKTFMTMSEYRGTKADLSLSLDVIYHLVEDEVFESYVKTLFRAADRYVIVYSSNEDYYDPGLTHIRHRAFAEWVEQNLPEWKLIKHVPNRFPYKGNYKKGSWSDFFFYEKAGQAAVSKQAASDKD